MPDFLEKKLKAEYGNNDRAVYGTMNNIGAMHGNKITAKGRQMEAKHANHIVPMFAGGIAGLEDPPDAEAVQQAAFRRILGLAPQQAQRPQTGLGAPPPPPTEVPDAPEQSATPPPLPESQDGSADTADTAPEPPKVIEAPAAPPPPVVEAPSTPSAPSDEPALGRNPMYRRGQMAQMQTQDETPRPIDQRRPITQAYEQNMAKRAAEAKRGNTKWDVARTILAGAASISPRTQGIAGLLLHPPDKQAEITETLRKGAEEERKQDHDALQADLLKQRTVTSAANAAALVDTRETNAQTRHLNAETAAQHVAAIQDEKVRKWVEDKIGKSRMPDATYQKQSDTRPAGYEFVENPTKPGEGWAVPPAWMPMPKELVAHAPGYGEGQLTPHSVVQRATADYNKKNLEITKAENKPDPKLPLENQIVNEHIAKTHPGESLAEARQHTAPPPRPKQPPQALMFVPDPDGKGGQTAVSVGPGTRLPAGAMTSAGVNTSNTQTAQNRTRSEFAQTVVDQVPKLYGRIDALGAKIGPGAGRWNQMWVNKAGMDDPDFSRLDQDLKMYASAVVVAHFGARGGGKDYREALEKNFGEAQSPANLKARIESADDWLTGYAKMGQPKTSTSATPAAPAYKPNDTRNVNGVNYKRDAQGVWHPQ